MVGAHCVGNFLPNALWEREDIGIFFSYSLLSPWSQPSHPGHESIHASLLPPHTKKIGTSDDCAHSRPVPSVIGWNQLSNTFSLRFLSQFKARRGKKELEKKEESKKNSRKSVTWSAVPDAPMLFYFAIRWWVGQRPRRGRWPMIPYWTIAGSLIPDFGSK